jgi:hypothetical protein
MIRPEELQCNRIFSRRDSNKGPFRSSSITGMSRSLRLAFLLLLAAPVAAQPAPDYVRIPFNVSFWRGISVGDAVAADTSRKVLHHVSLNLPAGRADRLEGVAVGVFSTVYEESAYGVQAAGLANVAGEESAVIQVAGLANVVGEGLTGVQLAGLANISGGRLQGIQVSGLANVAGEGGGFLQAAGLANVAGERFAGVQAAGLASVAGERFRGIQSAGLANIAGENVEGAQAAGLANIAGEDLRGVQSAGLANIVGEDLVGLQTSLFNVVGGRMRGGQVGLVNVAATSAGLQVGLVNVAGEQRGVPVGLYSRTEGVPVRLDVWTDETAALHVGVRSGSAVVSNYVGISARPFADAALRWGAFAGLGVERPFDDRTAWGLDAFVHGLFAEDFGDGASTLVRLRFIVTRVLSPGVAVFGGPAASLFISDEDDGSSLAPFSVFEDEGSTFVRAWPGLEVGLRIRITDD